MSGWDDWMNRYMSAGATGVVMFGKDGTEWFKKGDICVDNTKLSEFPKKAKNPAHPIPPVGGKKFQYIKHTSEGVMFKCGPESLLLVEGPGGDSASRPYVLLHSTTIKPEFLLSGVCKACGTPAAAFDD